MRREVAIDLVDIKQKIASGRFAVKINSLGNILLEDTLTCEAIKLMTMPEGYSFHEKCEWHPVYVHTSNSVAQPMLGEEGWECSVCGEHTLEKHDWCTCGADMRGGKR
jgi:hypothetical protein